MCIATSFAESAFDIAKKVHDLPSGKTSSSIIDITLIDKNGKNRNRQLMAYTLKDGEVDKTVLVFKTPRDVAGISYLSYDYPDKKDGSSVDSDSWIYIPAMKKVRRVSGSSKDDDFQGTDFTYDDMGDRNLDEDTHKFLRKEKCGGFDCYVVESVPKDKREIYSKKISWIRKDCFMAVKVEFYDKLGKLHRVLNVQDIKQVQGFWTRGKMEMQNVQTKHKTIITFSDMKYNLKIGSDMFNVAKMEKGI